MILLTSKTKISSLQHNWLHPYLLMNIFFSLFQRQWNHSPNFEIPTLLRRLHVLVNDCCWSNSNGKWHLHRPDFRKPVQLCGFCLKTSVLPKWWYQFQKQGFRTRLVESFEERTFSEQYPNATCVSK